MNKAELYDILSSEFWKELTGRLAKAKSERVNDLMAVDLTTGEGLKIAMEYQADIRAIDKVAGIVEDYKEEVSDKEEG